MVLAALLLFLSPHGRAAPLKITIASDSTAAVFPPTDYGKRTGWGQVLSHFFNTNVKVDDLASSGRSSKSFYNEGKWAACLATHANYYFIVECLLHSTNASLAPLRKAVNLKAVHVQAARR